MFSEPEPLGMHFTSRPSQSGDELPVDDGEPVAGVRAGGLARDRVHGVRAQRVLERGAAGALAQGLVDAGRVQREALAQPHVVDGHAGVLADQVLSLSATETLVLIVSRIRLPGPGVSRSLAAGGRRAGPGGCPSATIRRGARRRPRRSAAGLWSCRAHDLCGLRGGAGRHGGRRRCSRAGSCPSCGCGRARRR